MKKVLRLSRKKPPSYSAPKVSKTVKEPVGLTTTAYKKSLKDKEPFMFGHWSLPVMYGARINPPEVEEEISRFLRSKGVNAGRYLSAGKSYSAKYESEKRHALSYPKGRDLASLSDGLDRKTKVEIIKQVAKLLGKMHALGVTHNDVHWGNLTWDGKQVGVIDFKRARRASFEAFKDFNRPLSKPSIRSDLAGLRKLVFVLMGTSYRKEFLKPEYFKPLVDQYPLKAKERKQMLEEIMARIMNH